MMLPEFDHKKEMLTKFLKQDGQTVKGLEEAGKYLYHGLTPEQKGELADTFMKEIEEVFKTLHRDYSQMVFNKLSPSFLGREKDIKTYKEILERSLSNTHFANLLRQEISKLEIVVEQKK